MSLISALKRQRQEDKLKGSLVYTVSSRPIRTRHQDPISNNNSPNPCFHSPFPCLSFLTLQN